MFVICDKCKKEFDICAKSIKSLTINNITVNYFECISCKKKYITDCYDDYVKREKRKLEKMNENISKSLDPEERETLMFKLRKQLKHLKVHSDRLKSEVEKLLIQQN